MRTRQIPRDVIALVALLSVAAIAIAWSRGSAADMSKRVKETTDSYALPPPEQVAALSLGYRAALADYLWADVLVEQGLHSFDRRQYEHLTLYIDTINHLDPGFREPYLLVDSLVAFQARGPSLDDVRNARRILERGVAARPDDGEIWLTLGTFVGLLAPSSYLTDPEEIQQWKLDGARYLAKAAALGDDAHVGWGAISGVRLLRRAGRRTEAIRMLTSTLATTDDEDLRAHAKDLLDQLTKAEDAFEAAEERNAYKRFRRREARLDEIWRTSSAILSRTGVLLLNPPYDEARCAGRPLAPDPACAHTFRDWARRIDAEPQ